jgi:NhaC family Na+:H+ antiporter
MAQTLGVATVAYLPYAFFNLINPVVAAVYGFTGFSITKLEPGQDAEQLAASVSAPTGPRA